MSWNVLVSNTELNLIWNSWIETDPLFWIDISLQLSEQYTNPFFRPRCLLSIKDLYIDIHLWRFHTCNCTAKERLLQEDDTLEISRTNVAIGSERQQREKKKASRQLFPSLNVTWRSEFSAAPTSLRSRRAIRVSAGSAYIYFFVFVLKLTCDLQVRFFIPFISKFFCFNLLDVVPTEKPSLPTSLSFSDFHLAVHTNL